jgi:sulfate permease, SulP family
MSTVESKPQTSAVATPVLPGAGGSLSDGLVPNLMAGTLSALVTLSYSISYGVLIYSGTALQPHLAMGIHAALMAAWIVALIVALRSSFPFSIAGPDSNATAILAVMSANIAALLGARNASAEQVGATVTVMIWMTSGAVGAIVFLIGALKRGRLIRFLPYPVVGGFLAGTGLLVVGGGFKVVTGESMKLETLRLISSVTPLALVVAGGVALALLILPRLYKHFLIMPVVIVVGMVVFYAGLRITHTPIDEARRMGMLFEPFESARPGVGASATFGLVAWDVLLSQWQNLLAMTIVVVITILLNATGLDLATQTDVDFDRELRVNGLANMLSGLGGGMIGYISISRSLINYKAGAVSRVAGVWTAIVCLGATFVFTPALSYFPRPVLAGILLFLGIGMLREWIYDSFFKLPLTEYTLIITIVLMIALLGLMPGVAFGLLVASVLFVYTYSKTRCIKHSFSSATHFSNKERSLEQIAQLKERGHLVQALCLQGYIFFGTSSSIVEQCREMIAAQRMRYVILDFRMVQGLDASAVLSFVKLEQICKKADVKLVFCAVKQDVDSVLQQTKFLPNKGILSFPDLDHALESCEDNLLGNVAGAIFDSGRPGESGNMLTAAVAEMDLRRILAAHFEPAALDIVIAHCQTLKLPEGTTLFNQGDPGDALYFVERGELTVSIKVPGGERKRLRTFGPGTVVGEMALYSKGVRSADVIVTNMACRVRKFSSESLANMERKHPDVAIAFHSFVIRLLATRLIAANEQIRSLI